MPERSRSRSRSPDHRKRHSRSHGHSHYRSRSPHRHGTHHKASKNARAAADKPLPFNARQISKHELRIYRPMFGLYLDVQKRLDIEDISEDEVRGRWKSFVGKWNRGELAEGWYDPKTFEKAVAAGQEQSTNALGEDTLQSNRHTPRGVPGPQNEKPEASDENDEDDDDDFGPAMPHAIIQQRAQGQTTSRSGPAIPTLQDLQARNEQQREYEETIREHGITQIRSERKLDRRLQRERLDDLTPRAEVGSRERMLENRQIAANSNRAFASAAHDGGDVDLKDTDVMGDDEDSIGTLRRMQKEQERKKNEREIRREEIIRARIAEREERVKGLREKENKTMDMLKRIAQARFGTDGQNQSLDQG